MKAPRPQGCVMQPSKRQQLHTWAPRDDDKPSCGTFTEACRTLSCEVAPPPSLAAAFVSPICSPNPPPCSTPPLRLLDTHHDLRCRIREYVGASGVRRGHGGR
jgi:hypothetical protein